MPLTEAEEKMFRELKRIKDREYARHRRDKERKIEYKARTTRKDKTES